MLNYDCRGRVTKKVVPTFSDKEVELLLAQPNKKTDRGFRDYALLLTFVDTAARLSEIGSSSTGTGGALT